MRVTRRTPGRSPIAVARDLYDACRLPLNPFAWTAWLLHADTAAVLGHGPDYELVARRQGTPPRTSPSTAEGPLPGSDSQLAPPCTCGPTLRDLAIGHAPTCPLS